MEETAFKFYYLEFFLDTKIKSLSTLIELFISASSNWAANTIEVLSEKIKHGFEETVNTVYIQSGRVNDHIIL